jgi:hypothetical protein
VGTKKQKSEKEEDGKENDDAKGAPKKKEGQSAQIQNSEEAELRDTFNRIRTAASAVGGEIGKHTEE